jgi:hypothetical protein
MPKARTPLAVEEISRWKGFWPYDELLKPSGGVIRLNSEAVTYEA